MAITMTEKAADHVKRQLDQRGKGIGIRVGVKTTGCSGMAYVLEFVDEANSEDVVYQYHGVQLLVDHKSLVYIDGTEMDFVKKGLNDGFEFNNPNIRKVIEIINDHILTSPPYAKGYKAISKKTIKKTIPKLRLELILTSSI